MLLAFLVAAGCGGQRQSSGIPAGKYPVAVTVSEFPTRQHIGSDVDLRLGVRNTGKRPLPDLTIRIQTESENGVANDSFSIRENDPNLSDASRPVWILNNGYPVLEDQKGPAGADTAATNSFGFGQVAPGEEKIATWKLSPARRGTFVLTYRVFAAQSGGAKAVDENGEAPNGSFQPTISAEVPETAVSPSGRVEPAR